MHWGCRILLRKALTFHLIYDAQSHTEDDQFQKQQSHPTEGLTVLLTGGGVVFS